MPGGDAPPHTLRTHRTCARLPHLSPQEARTENLLQHYDTTQDVQAVASRNCIVFISHQWKCREEPDPTGEDWRAAVLAIECLAATYRHPLESFLVWIDYTSIPQRNRSCQGLSISSLPFYASFARYFLVLTPRVAYGGREYDLVSYQRRGWCRLEQFARIAMCGVSHMYICYGTAEQPAVSMSDKLGVLTAAVEVMEGDFTVDADKAKLVDTLATLYFRLLMLHAEFALGARVRHTTCGLGIVMAGAAEGIGRITVLFDSAEQHTYSVTSIAKKVVVVDSDSVKVRICDSCAPHTHWCHVALTPARGVPWQPPPRAHLRCLNQKAALEEISHSGSSRGLAGSRRFLSLPARDSSRRLTKNRAERYAPEAAAPKRQPKHISFQGIREESSGAPRAPSLGDSAAFVESALSGALRVGKVERMAMASIIFYVRANRRRLFPPELFYDYIERIDARLHLTEKPVAPPTKGEVSDVIESVPFSLDPIAVRAATKVQAFARGARDRRLVQFALRMLRHLQARVRGHQTRSMLTLARSVQAELERCREEAAQVVQARVRQHFGSISSGVASLKLNTSRKKPSPVRIEEAMRELQAQISQEKRRSLTHQRVSVSIQQQGAEHGRRSEWSERVEEDTSGDLEEVTSADLAVMPRSCTPAAAPATLPPRAPAAVATSDGAERRRRRSATVNNEVDQRLSAHNCLASAAGEAGVHSDSKGHTLAKVVPLDALGAKFSASLQKMGSVLFDCSASAALPVASASPSVTESMV